MTNVTENTFKTEVLQNKGLVLVDFWAPWCGPCRMIGPILEEISREKGELVKIVKVNVDENQGLASQYGVMSIPTMIIFKDGELIDKFIGAFPKKVIEERLERFLS